MWQNNRSKSFLLMLYIFSLTSTVIATLTDNDCEELNYDGLCECASEFYVNDEESFYAIYCPSTAWNLQIAVVMYEHNNSVEVEITFNDIEGSIYKILPVLDIGVVYNLTLTNYPLTTEPVSKLLHQLNMMKLEHLYITYTGNLKENITRKHLSGLKELKTLSLYDSDMSLVAEDLFADVPKLTKLCFEIGNIENVPNILAPLKNLKHLSFSSKNLKQILAGIFRNQRHLEFLKINFMQLRNIGKNLFFGAKSLIVLDLSDNKIESLQPEIFSQLKNLQQVDLSNNFLLELPPGLFSRNKALRKVNIRNNHVRLKALPPALFANLEHLFEVDIFCGMNQFLKHAMRISCGLHDISADSLVNSNRFREISLAQNELVTLDATLFDRQIHLYQLNISHNKLQSLPDELFYTTHYIKSLDLSYNQLTEITSKIFSLFYSLQELYIGNNLLVTISPDAFIATTSLNIISMENNEIDLSAQKESSEIKAPIRFPKYLEKLNLRNTTLRTIMSEWRYNMTELRELDLSYNNITSLNCSDLIFQSNRKLSINLSYNQINKINFQNITRLAESLNRSISVQLNKNPLDCDCNLLQFVQYARGTIPHTKLKLITDDLVCDRPQNIKGLNKSDVNPKLLLCPIMSLYCPDDCECSEHTFDLVLVVNCSNKNFKEVPALPRVRLQALESIELHITNNKLEKLPIVSATTGYANVTKIYAAGNRLSHIDVHNLPENLTYLDLSRNKFEKLNNEVLNFFKQNNSTRKMALSENPWSCECKNKQMMVFVTKSNATISDIQNVNCSTPTNEKMSDYCLSNDICEYERIVIITFSVVGFSIGLAVALYYKFQTEIKVWLYKYRICSCLVNESELDKNKKYDAFISYSHKDELFLVEHLVPQLEEGPIRFKLCIDVRDFVIGACIPDQIISAIDDSRRTIIVLSENFINSMWARMELHLAHKAALNEGRTRVIVIIYGDIGDRSTLDKDLQAYLKMNIYLGWGDPWFWEKLRYAMPHPSRKVKNLKKRKHARNGDDNMEFNEMVQVSRENEHSNELS